MDPNPEAAKRVRLDREAQLIALVSSSVNGAQPEDLERLLDEAGGGTEITDDTGSNLLHLALDSRNLLFAEILFRRGVDVDAKNDDGDTPAVWAKDMLELKQCSKKEEAILLKIVSRSRDFGEYTSHTERVDIIEVEPIQNSGCLGVNSDLDDLEEVKRKLRVENTEADGNVVLKRDVYANVRDYRDVEGNSLLMKFAMIGKLGVLKLLLQCQAIDVNAMNFQDKTAADICWEKKYYTCLLKLLEADADFPHLFEVSMVYRYSKSSGEFKSFIEKRVKLHEDIKNDDLESVKEATKNIQSLLYLNPKNRSALWSARKNRKLKLYAYLQSRGARFKNSKEEEEDRLDDTDLESVRVLSEEYFVRSENAHILERIASTSIVGEFKDCHKKKIRDLYKHLDKYECVSLLMKVLRNRDVDVVIDFEREDVGGICQGTQGDLGMTDCVSRRIYLGAKGCVCADKIDLGVAGTLAHEICHMAMHTMYNNGSKPYSDNGERMNERENEFKGIVTDLYERQGELCETIRSVFECYDEDKWDAELIVRVPLLLVTLGEERGRHLLETEALQLYNYYTKYIIRDCKEYIKDIFFTKPIVLTKNLLKYLGCKRMIVREKIWPKESMHDFHDTLNEFKNLNILKTSNAILALLHVYQNLKMKFESRLDKRCLFFEMKCFEDNYEEICTAFSSTVCEYLILMSKGEEPNYSEISGYFPNVLPKRKKIILIVEESCKTLSLNQRDKTMEYAWDDLSETSKEFILKSEVKFQGECIKLQSFIDTNSGPLIFRAEELSYFMNNKSIKIGNSENMTSEGYHPEYYVERRFSLETMDNSVIKKVTDDNKFLITGIGYEELGKIINKNDIQVLNGTEEIDLENKSILLLESHTYTTRDIVKFFTRLNRIHWLQYHNGKFVRRRTKGTHESISSQAAIDPTKLIDECLQNRAIIIADNPGSGKSTVITDLIRKIKQKHPEVWTVRINLNDHAIPAKHSHSLENINLEKEASFEDVTGNLVKILGMESPLEVSLFKRLCKIPSKVRVFFDGADEICPKFRDLVCKLLRRLKCTTNAQLWVTSRTHEKDWLEDALDSFSYGMEMLPFVKQVECMSRFWIYKLKCLDIQEKCSRKAMENICNNVKRIRKQIQLQTSKHNNLEDYESLNKAILEAIYFAEGVKETSKLRLMVLRQHLDNLDLSKYISKLLQEMEFPKDDKQLAGMPFNLCLLAEVVFEDNLETCIPLNLFCLFSQLADKKIIRFIQDKYIPENQNHHLTEDSLNASFRAAHQMIAVQEIAPHLDKSIYLSLPDSVLPELHKIGLVLETQKFVDRKFAEYFFSDFLFENIEKEEVQSVVLEQVMVELKHRFVRKLLNCRFQSTKKNIEFCDRCVKKLNLKKIFCMLNNSGTDEFLHILPSVIGKVARLHGPDEIVTHFRSVAQHILQGEEVRFKSIFNIFKILDIKLLDEMFKVNYFPNKESLCHSLERYLQNLKSLNSAISHNILMECFMVTDSRNNSILHIAACKKWEEFQTLFKSIEALADRKTFHELLKKPNDFGENFLLYTLKVNDPTMFIQMMNFLEQSIDGNLFLEIFSGHGYMGNCLWHQAAKLKDIKVLKTIMKNCKDLSIQDSIANCNDFGETVLHLITEHGEGQIIEEAFKILERYFDTEIMKILIQSKSDSLQTLLHVSASTGVFSTVFNILNSRKNSLSKDFVRDILMSVDASENTFLHLSARFNNFLDCLEELLNMKDILQDSEIFQLMSKRNAMGETFLHILLHHSHYVHIDFEHAVDTMDSLLKEDQKVDIFTIQNNKKETILHMVNKSEHLMDIYTNIYRVLEICMNFLKIPEKFSQFLEKSDLNGDTFLHTVLSYYEELPYLGFHKIYPRDRDVNALLRFAGKSQELRVLLTRPNSKGTTFLHIVAEFGTLWGLKYTIDFMLKNLGHDEFWRLFFNANGSTILHASARNYDFEVLEYLLKCEYLLYDEYSLKFLNKTDESGNTFFHIAAKYGHSICSIFKKMRVIYNYHKVLLKPVDYYGKRNGKGQTPLHCHFINAYPCNCLGDDKILLEDEFSKILTTADDSGNTLLHASSRCKYAMYMVLILKEAKEILSDNEFLKFIEKVNDNKDTFLHLAAAWQVQFDEILILLKEYMQPNSLQKMLLQENNDGNCIMQMAAKNKNAYVLKKILKLEGFKDFIVQKNNNGETIFHLICDCTRREDLHGYMHIMREQEESLQRQLLLMKDKNDDSVLHISARNQDADTLATILRHAQELLNDASLIDFLKKTNKRKRTFLHSAVEGLHTRVFKSKLYTLEEMEKNGILDLYLEESSRKEEWLQEILPEDPDDVQIFRKRIAHQISNRFHSRLFHRPGGSMCHVHLDRFKRMLNLVSDIMGAENLFQLIDTTDLNGDTFLHYAASQISITYVRAIVRFVWVTLGDEALRALLKKPNKEDNSVLLMAANNRSVEVRRYVMRIARSVFSESEFSDLEKVSKCRGETVYQEPNQCNTAQMLRMESTYWNMLG